MNNEEQILTQKQQVKQAKKEKKMRKRARLRPLKNFIWWLTGVITSFVLIIGTVVVGVAVLPVSTYLGLFGINDTSNFVSDEISEGTILSNVMNVQNYSMNDIPILKSTLLSLADTVNGLSPSGSALVEFDQAKFNELSDKRILGDVSGFLSGFTGCINVVATVSSVVTDLGAIGELSVIKDFEEITSDEDLANYFESGSIVSTPQLYYYDQSQLSSTLSSATNNFVRMFNDDGSLVEELVDLSTDQLSTLKFYYPALSKIPVLDIPAIIGPRFKMLTVGSILTAFSGSADGLIIDLIGDETIESLGSLSMESFKLISFIDAPTEENNYANKELFDLLKEATGSDSYEDITLDKLTQIDINNVSISSFIEVPSEENDYANKELFDLLKEATGSDSYEDITLDKLSNINLDLVKISSFIEVPSEENDYANKELFDLLKEATGSDSYEDITLDKLSNINLDLVKLSSIIEAPSEENSYKNQKLYDILLDITSNNSYDEITISSLDNIDTNKISLAHVLEAPTATNGDKNKILYDILLDAVDIEIEGYHSYQLLKLEDLTHFEITHVKLVDFLAKPTAENNYKNKTLFDLLKDITKKQSYEEITIADLSDIHVEEISLVNVLEAPTEENGNANKMLYDILLEASGIENTGDQAYAQLKVKDLGNFSIENVKLSSLIASSSNDILTKLLEKDAENAGIAGYEPVTMGNIGDKINELSVMEIYDVTCFTTDETQAREDAIAYYKSTEVGQTIYSTTGSGTKYYISKTANVWLFLVYTAENVDVSNVNVLYSGTGIAERYVEKTVTLSDFNQSIEGISDNIMGATIRQAYDSGIINEKYEKIFGLTFIDVMHSLNSQLS